MDEIGLIVKSISETGVIRVATIGGIDPLACLNQQVIIQGKKKPIRGVVTTVHLSEAEDEEELPIIGDLIVDTGLNKKELNKLGVSIGSLIEFEQNATYLGSNKYLMGKAVDDRVGCFILLEMIKKTQKLPGNFYFVFTVQEEVGLYGARTSVYNLNPDGVRTLVFSS